MLLLPITRMDLARFIPQNGSGAEIGVSRGEFSRVLLSETRPALLHLIDPWEKPADLLDTSSLSPAEKAEKVFHSVESMMAPEIRAGRVVIHRQYSQAALGAFPPDSLDWAYIDGAHDEANVAADLACCAAKMKPGGLIWGHDYTDRIPGFGVVPAVNRFVRDTDWCLLALTIEDVPTYVLGKDTSHPAIRLFLALLYRLVPGMIELPDDLARRFHHTVHAFDEGGANLVMTF